MFGCSNTKESRFKTLLPRIVEVLRQSVLAVEL